MLLFNLLHTAVLLVWIVLVTIFFGLLTTAVSFFSRTGNGPHLVARTWANSILLASGVRVKITGREHLPNGASAIYMSNHQSNYDIPVLLGRLPVQFRWLAKAELFKIPIFGRGMRGVGYISIDRSNRKSAFKSLARAAETIRNGTSVLIFPEGTRSSDGQLHSFKKGGFVLAVDAGVPIIPVTIDGTFSIMPRNRLLIVPRKVFIDIGPPIVTADYTRKTKDDLMQRVHDQMADAIRSRRSGGAHG